MEYRFFFTVANLNSNEEKLKKSIHLLTEKVIEDGSFEHINESALHKIVLSDSVKAYLCKEVDEENERGAFLPYKKIVDHLSQIILAINPKYKYARMLISTVIEGAHLQRHFAEHLPKLTSIIDGEDTVTAFYTDIVFKAIN